MPKWEELQTEEEPKTKVEPQLYSRIFNLSNSQHLFYKLNAASLWIFLERKVSLRKAEFLSSV